MLDDLAIRLRQNVGFATAIVLFCIFYLLYHLAHPKGFSSAVLVQNSDEIFALAMLAMAQTVPVLTSGLDLSVGAVLALSGVTMGMALTGAPRFPLWLALLAALPRTLVETKFTVPSNTSFG